MRFIILECFGRYSSIDLDSFIYCLRKSWVKSCFFLHFKYLYTSRLHAYSSRSCIIQLYWIIDEGLPKREPNRLQLQIYRWDFAHLCYYNLLCELWSNIAFMTITITLCTFSFQMKNASHRPDYMVHYAESPDMGEKTLTIHDAEWPKDVATQDTS